MELRNRKSSAGSSCNIPLPTTIELRYAILYGFRRKLTPVKILEEFQIAYSENAPCLNTISKWYRRFQTGHFDIEDEKRSGRPASTSTAANIDAVRTILQEDNRLTQDVIAERLGTNAMAISRILSENLNYTKKSARWVPRLLNNEEKVARVRFARYFLEKFDDGNASTFKNIVTGDEAWFYNKDPETKLQSMVWSPQGAAPPVKAKQERSKKKIMFAIFFTCTKVVAAIPLEEDATVTAKWYTTECLPKVFTNLLEGRPREQLRRYFLHHDNAPAHRAQITSNFIASSGITEINPAPYSPDLAPCDFWLFPKIKAPLRGRTFDNREDIISAVNHELNKLKKEDFEDCFRQWIYRLKKCIDIKGDYVEKM